MWDAALPRLAEHFRVVRDDHRGHGASPVPPGPYDLAGLAGDVVRLLDALGVERAHVAGLSLGEAIAAGITAGGGHAEVAVVPAAAHLAAVERPAEVAALLLGHLTPEPPPAPGAVPAHGRCQLMGRASP